MTVHEVVAQPATRAVLAPFGELLGTEDLEPLQRGSGFYATRTALFRPGVLSSDAPVDLLVYDSDPRPFEVRFLERHVQITQTFLPLGGVPYVVVVARPAAAEDEHGFPLLSEIHAFVVPGSVGINLHRGTWHEPPFPLVPSRFLITSHADLTQGLLSELDAGGELAKLDVEKRSLPGRTGARLLVRLPA